MGSEGRNHDRMSLNCVRKIRNTCVNGHVVTQGERGPPGNNGDKGERGDDVSNKKNLKIDIMLSDPHQIFIILIKFSFCVCLCFRVQVEKTGNAAK